MSEINYIPPISEKCSKQSNPSGKQSNPSGKQSNPSGKHFVIDIDFLDNIACCIAENIPTEYHKKFLIELKEYLKCANFTYLSSESDSENLSEDSGDELINEEIEVSIDENGFYSIKDLDIKDCNRVGKEEKKSN